MAARGPASVTKAKGPMDGAMPSSVLIILVAVVILIAVVVYGGLRYLRSDDEEEFDDGAAGRGSARGRADRELAQGRTRRDHDEFDADRDLPRPAARSGLARDPRARREAEPRREQRAERGGYYDDDRTEVVPAASRATRVQAGSGRGAAGSDTSPGRPRTSPREFDRDSRDFGRDGAAGNRSDIRDPLDGRAARSAPAVREMAVADLDAPDRRGAAKPASKPDGRKNGHGSRDQQDDVLPAVKPRQSKSQSKNQSKSKSKRDDDGDWPSNEWDELSDVDYWTELAADKPFTGDAPPAAARPGRPERAAARSSGRADATKRLDQPLLPPVGRPAARDRSADLAARDRSARPGGQGPQSADLAARDRSADLTAAGPRGSSSSRTRRPDADRLDSGRLDAERVSASRSLPRRPDATRSEPVPLRADPARPESRPARPAQSRPAAASLAASSSRHSAPLDDDPLTSPSFPRIDATDSRSYARSRSGTHERPAVRSATEYAAAPTSFDQPAAGYARPAADGFRAVPDSQNGSLPDSYLMPAANGSSRPAGDYPAESAAQYSSAQHSGAQYSGAQYSGAPQSGAPQSGAPQSGAQALGRTVLSASGLLLSGRRLRQRWFSWQRS